MTLRLIHFPMTRSLRVLWALEELGVPAEVETRPFDREKLKEPEYRKLNPLGKTPVFFDGPDRMIESTAIIQYIADRYADSRLSRRPSDADYGQFLQWLHFGEAGMGGYVGALIGHTALLPPEQRIPAMEIWARGEVENCLAFIEESLDGRDYLLGEFSLADISVGYLLFLLKVTRNGKLMGPRTAAWYDRLTARDAWKRASAVKPE